MLPTLLHNFDDFDNLNYSEKTFYFYPSPTFMTMGDPLSGIRSIWLTFTWVCLPQKVRNLTVKSYRRGVKPSNPGGKSVPYNRLRRPTLDHPWPMNFPFRLNNHCISSRKKFINFIECQSLATILTLNSNNLMRLLTNKRIKLPSYLTLSFSIIDVFIFDSYVYRYWVSTFNLKQISYATQC